MVSSDYLKWIWILFLNRGQHEDKIILNKLIKAETSVLGFLNSYFRMQGQHKRNSNTNTQGNCQKQDNVTFTVKTTQHHCNTSHVNCPILPISLSDDNVAILRG